jgi:cell division protein FtsQ
MPFLLPERARKWVPRVPAVVQWVGVSVLFLGLIAATGQRRFAKGNQTIYVQMAQQGGLQFVDEQQTHTLVQNQVLAAIKGQGHGKPIDLGEIEHYLETNPFIHKANISQALDGSMAVAVTQSAPVARIMGLFGSDSYITEQGRVIPVSPHYTARVLLLEGPGARRMVTGMANADTLSLQLFGLVQRLVADPFWKAQAAYLFIESDGAVRLYPQVGQQTFELGPPTELDAKFRRMQAFYDHILPFKGWARYSTVNVRYQNQIVCQ